MSVNSKNNLFEVFSTDVAVEKDQSGNDRFFQDLALWGNDPFPQKVTVSLESKEDFFKVGLYEISLSKYFEVQTNYGKVSLTSPKYPKYKNFLTLVDNKSKA